MIILIHINLLMRKPGSLTDENPPSVVEPSRERDKKKNGALQRDTFAYKDHRGQRPEEGKEEPDRKGQIGCKRRKEHRG